jgi:hypothetical protein
MESDPEWSFPNPDPPAKRSLGAKIAIGIAGSIGVWLVVDELLSIFNGYFLIACLGVVIGIIFLKGDHSKRSQQFWVLAILGASAAGWVLLVFLFSFFNVWLFLGLTAALGAVVFVKDRKQRQRQHWLDTGCCGNCGYDMRGTPDRCPECGRDASLDEPTWRKLRRQIQAERAAEAAGAVPPMIEARATPAPVARVPTVLKTPDFVQGPIPLEGDEPGAVNIPFPTSQNISPPQTGV